MTAERMKVVYYDAMTTASAYTLPSGTEVSSYEEWNRLCSIRDALSVMIEDAKVAV